MSKKDKNNKLYKITKYQKINSTIVDDGETMNEQLKL